MIARSNRRRMAMSRLWRDRRAAMVVEMAFVLPLFLVFAFGGVEIANLTLTNTRISQIGLSAADNASRIAFGSSLAQPQIREIDINEVFTGVEAQAEGLDFKLNGRIILSSLERNADDGQWIHWQRCYGDMKVDSAYGPEGTGITGTGFPGMGPAGAEVTAPAGTAVMFVEITYQYKSLVFGNWLGPQTIQSTAAFNIREGRDLRQVFNLAPAVTPSTCS